MPETEVTLRPQAQVPRNVVTLSNIPRELHDWLKQEAVRLSEKTGKRTGLYQVVLLAIERYRASVENNPSGGEEVSHG